jgi:hypothetical protein
VSHSLHKSKPTQQSIEKEFFRRGIHGECQSCALVEWAEVLLPKRNQFLDVSPKDIRFLIFPRKIDAEHGREYRIHAAIDSTIIKASMHHSF